MPRKSSAAIQLVANGLDLNPRRSEKKSLVDSATDLLRDRILDLTLAPGQKLDEQLLADQFGLSRTPTREALNRLAAEGLVDIRSNRGFYVTQLDLDHILQLFDAYTLGERMVGFLCQTDDVNLIKDLKQIQKSYARVQSRRDLLEVTRQNNTFHSRLAMATRNSYVYSYSKRLYNIARRVSFFIYQRESNPREMFNKHALLINDDHELIIRHIENGDNRRLIETLTSHAMLFRTRLMRVLTAARAQDFPVEWQRRDRGADDPTDRA